jgi:uncharacterized protein (TIGR03437 family)
MTYLFIVFLTALTCAAQSRSVIVLPAGPAIDPANRNATILDVETWKPVGNPTVGADAYDAFTLPDGSKTYVVSKSVANTITVLGLLASGGPVLASIELAAGLTDAALTPDGKRLLIVSTGDSALTIVNTATDRVIAKVALEAPAHTVVVNFESTQAFTASRSGALITRIDLGANVKSGTLALPNELPATNQLAFAPNALLYIVAGEVFNEIDPRSLKTIAAKVPAKGVYGRPQFVMDGSQALLIGSEGLMLIGLRQAVIAGSYSDPDVAIDRVRIVGESLAIGYSSRDRAFYRIGLKPFLEVAPLPDFASLGSESLAGLGGSNEDPLNRYLYLSAGKTTYRVDPRTNAVTASLTMPNLAGTMISPPVPSRKRGARLRVVDPVQSTLAPMAVRVVDVDGIPVANSILSFDQNNCWCSISGPPLTAFPEEFMFWDVVTNSQGYAQTAVRSSKYPRAPRVSVFGTGAAEMYSSFALTRPNEPPLIATQAAAIDGSEQLVYSASEASEPLRVYAWDRFYFAVPGVAVDWSVVSGGGRVKWTRTYTDSQGYATNTFVGPALPSGSASARSIVRATPSVGGTGTLTLITIPQPSGEKAIPGLTRLEAQPLSGPAGSTLKDALRYQLLDGDGRGIPGVSFEVRSVEGVRATRCSPAAVTDNNGLATCHLLIGHGTDIAKVYVGGQFVENLSVAATPGRDYKRIRVIGGSVQLWGDVRISRRADTLLAIIEDGFGNALSGVPVTWKVASGSATLSNSSSQSALGRYTDPENPAVTHSSNGLVSTGVILGSGEVRVQLILPTYYDSNVDFIMGADGARMTQLDGGGQSAAVGREFARPLVVEVRDKSGEPIRGLPIEFSATGGLGLSASQAFTDPQGRAELQVTAGQATGSYQISVTADSASTVFVLRVTPEEAPFISSVTNGASFGAGLSPCSIGQVNGGNLASRNSIGVAGLAAPLYHASTRALAFQVPCELSAGAAALRLISGEAPLSQQVSIASYSPGIFETPEKTVVAVRPDGSYVSPANPAVPGEEIRLFVTGLGQATPTLVTGQPGAGERVIAKVIVGLGPDGFDAEAVYAPTLTGTYIVKFRLPQNAVSSAIGVAVQTAEGALIHGQPSRIHVR